MNFYPLSIVCPSCGTKTEYRSFCYRRDGMLFFEVWCEPCRATRNLTLRTSQLMEWASKFEGTITAKDESFLHERGISWE